MILEKIVQHKIEEVRRRKAALPAAELARRIRGMRSFRDFAGAIRSGECALIAEVKKASPSRGRLREDFDPSAIARAYEDGGAAALSVVTDGRFFEGDPSFLSDIRRETGLPLLRKDFVIDPYQIGETVLLGGDAVLLIARILEPRQLRDFIDRAGEAGLAALVEIHDEEDLEKALVAEARIIGINNRDLATFAVDLATSLRLASLVPGGITVVSESGIRSREDVERLMQAGIRAFLVGEALVAQEDVAGKVRELRGRG